VLDQLTRPARFVTRVLHANVSRPARPWKLNVALTYWCQYRCETCNIWRRKPADELTTSELVSFIRQNGGVSWVDLTGGEIFLRPDIAEIFDAVMTGWRDLVVLHFPTNGFLTDRIVAAATQLAAGPIPHVVITVSVDGDEALNDRIRGIKGGFRKQVETFNRLRALKRIQVVFGMTQSRFNVGRFEETFAALHAECPGLTVDDMHLNVAQVSEHYYGNADGQAVTAPAEPALRELRAYRAHRERTRSAAQWLEGAFLDRLPGYIASGTTPMPCHSLRSSCFVDPWGAVYPCITYNRVIGQLRETGMRLEPIWSGESARRVQQEIWDGQCPQCWTACEAYQSILGNLVRPFRAAASSGAGR
jgi:radical SAM protein with 4Fe4S-binding SPASM domain